MTSRKGLVRRCIPNSHIHLLLFVIPLCTGCVARVIEPRASSLSPPSDPLDWSDWALVLSRAVEGDRVNYHALAGARTPLDRFLLLLARSGPDLNPAVFTNSETRLALAINAHNAAVVAAVLDLQRSGQIPQRLPSGFDQAHAIRFDGKVLSIAALRRLVRDLAADDWRPMLALYQGCVTGPDLERHMFLPDMLDARLNKTARTQLASRGVVQISHGAYKQLLLWRELYDSRQSLQRAYEKRTDTWGAAVLNGLLIWADPDQRIYLNSAVGYEVAPMPTDPTIDAVVTKMPPPPAAR